MTVKIVTDSAADIPDDDMKTKGITVVPTYSNFDGKTFKDGVDIDRDTFYNDLLDQSDQPDYIRAFTR